MLCEVCVWMLRGRRGQNFGGTLGLQFVHHDSAESFWASVARDCSICRALGDEVGANFFPALKRMASAHQRAFLDLRSLAHLSAVQSVSDPVYRLDFLVEWAGIKFRRTFVLRPIGLKDEVESPVRTPVSDQMYHAEVLGLAKTWLEQCKCVSGRTLKKEEYPTRLINLAELKKLGTIDTTEWKYHGDLEMNELGNTTVNLVDTDDLDWSTLQDNPAYVTLSHKWGGTDKPFRTRLTRGTEKAYRKGVRLGDLPRTFQDAIHFALRVDDRVRYIWIDSLCIIQGDEEDWLKESARMHDVYRNSFLNISATAAEHSGEGLYSHRDPQHLWEEVIRLDVGGLHQVAETVRQRSRKTNCTGGPNPAETKGPAPSPKFTPLAKVQSCLLVDVSNWETLVNQAPVNNRGWVVQERLLAPRVLHFCRGRVAWECGEFDDIEGHVPGVPKYQLNADEIYESVPIKGLEPGKHGKSLRNNRLRGVVDPVDLAENDPESRIIHSLELWSRTVEMYCKTDLTQQKDKLIALSGIAHSMANIIAESGQIQYIAGLWDVHLISQLLWHVEPVFRGDSDSSSDTIEYLSKRPTEYRAPSFSWASVDAQFGRGIASGHVLDSDAVLIEVLEDEHDSGLKPKTEVWQKGTWVHSETDNKFGLVTSGHIRVWAWLHHVKLEQEGTHYYWSLLVNNDSGAEPDKSNKAEKKNFNVHLDCPRDDDKENRLIKSDKIYCIPMAYGPSSGSTDIICLLLEKVELLERDAPLEKAINTRQILEWPDEYRQKTFKRIGYTKLSATFEHFTWDYVSNFKPNQQCSDDFYDKNTGRHLLCII